VLLVILIYIFITVSGYEKHNPVSVVIFNIALYFITPLGINVNGISMFPLDKTWKMFFFIKS